VSIETLDFGLEHVIGAHTAKREIPHPLLILRAVGMGIEVKRPRVPLLHKELHQEEHRLDTLAAKAQILVVARSFLIVEVNIEKFAHFQYLGHPMDKIESGHVFMGNLWIEANHIRMIEGVDKGKHMPDSGQIGIGAWFIRFWLQRET